VTWLVVVVGLLGLVFLHELGHFTVALAVGIRPRSFYVGFPPAIAKIKRNGIEYGIGAIPLGGLVRIPGMHRPSPHDLEAFMATALREDPSLVPAVQRVRRLLEAGDLAGAREALPELQEQVEHAELSSGARRAARRALRDVEEGTSTDAYWSAPTWKRVAVIAAGPFMNILVAFLIFFAVYATDAPTGNPTAAVASIEAHTPAAAAGLRPGDRIVAVSGHPTQTFAAVSREIRSSHGKPITVTVERGGKRVTLGPRPTIFLHGKYIWGFSPQFQSVSYSPGKSARLAADDCWRVVTGTATALKGLFSSSQQRAQISGPVGIVRSSQQALQIGFNWYLQLLGLISMSLALLNLLPLLPLDGGHILFSLIESVRRRALAREVYERVSFIGMALIVILMYIALHNDVTGGGPR
jgi:regulator of sigma E protease